MVERTDSNQSVSGSAATSRCQSIDASAARRAPGSSSRISTVRSKCGSAAEISSTTGRRSKTAGVDVAVDGDEHLGLDLDEVGR